MKKYYFILAAAALGFASCSNDETIESAALSESNAISFQPVLNGVTRTSPSVSNETAIQTNGFYAAAYQQGTSNSYFAADHFTYSEGSYKGTKTYYWPAYALDFYAWYPDDTQLSHSSYNQFTFVPDGTTLTNHKDFIIAASLNKSKPSPMAGVPLAFKHLGAWIDVQVYNSKGTNAGNLNATVSGWKIGYLHKGGIYTIAESTTNGSALPTTSGSGWSYTGYDAVATNVPAEYKVASLASSFVSGLDGTYDAISESVSIGEAIIVPQETTKMNDNSSKIYNAGGRLSGAFIALKLQIVDSDGHTLVDATSVDGGSNDLWAIWPINNDWVAGTKYTYKIDVSQGGYKETGTAGVELNKWFDGAEIYFSSVTVTDWTDGTASVVTP